MKYQIIPVTPFQQNCSLIWCEKTKRAAVVDPGGNIDRIQNEVTKLGLVLDKIILAHGHIDHVGGVPRLKDTLSIPVFGPQKADAFWLDCLNDQAKRFGFLGDCATFVPEHWLEEGDTLTVGNETLIVKHIPGHTPGHVVFYHQGSGLLIAGDVLFYGSVGRTDFPMGNHEDLLSNIKEKLLGLPDDTVVIPGHGALTTIGRERTENPYLKNLA